MTQIFEDLDPDLPVARLISLRQVMDRAFALPRFMAAFLTLVAVFAFALAGVGLYGLVADAVLQRRSEMGLRMALGATPARAVWTTALDGIRLTLLGLVLGGVLCVGIGRVITGLIWGITPHDPVALGGLLAAILLLAAVASLVPAARVGRIDPATILREG